MCMGCMWCVICKGVELGLNDPAGIQVRVMHQMLHMAATLGAQGAQTRWNSASSESSSSCIPKLSVITRKASTLTCARTSRSS